jgi:CheY-like chemotaxis protein
MGSQRRAQVADSGSEARDKMAPRQFHGPPPQPVPAPLIRSILSGNCVAFVGAGFSAAAGLPGWKALLQLVADSAAFSAAERDRFLRLLESGGGHALDRAAQLLEDRLDRKTFVTLLGQKLSIPSLPAAMERRRWLLQRIPFRAVLTTNFDEVLPGARASPAAYASVLRPRPLRWWDETFWNEEQWPPVVQLHGRLSSRGAQDDVVVTRRDYRRRLYQDSAYVTFLRSVLATNTVLYLGFSFDDAYLNELRSEVLSLLGHEGFDEPVAYAVANDAQEPMLELFARHEGIQLLTFDTATATGEQDYSGFDRYLEALYECTNPVPRFTTLLANRRLLWVDPNQDNNEPGRAFLRRVGAPQEGLVEVGSVQEAVAALEAAKKRRPFDLVITHWGEPKSPRARPCAVALLETIRRRDLRCPVVVFGFEEDVAERQGRATALGAYGYFHRFETLFQEMERILQGHEERQDR